jgi:hypothetical protein
MFGNSLEQDLEHITLIRDQIIDESGGSKDYHDIKLINICPCPSYPKRDG